MPTVGNPAYAHLHHYGISPVDQATATMSRGGWIPMVRPYLGNRTFGTNQKPQPCADDTLNPPVELVDFRGDVRNSGVQLAWETATEINNSGFDIERRSVNDNSDWQTIAFVEGMKNSKVLQSYTYFDDNVLLNKTYEYRLRQIDLDGTVSCYEHNTVTVTFDKVGSLTVKNGPNPFSSSTMIQFNLPQPSNVRLEILDIFGNVVKVLHQGDMAAQGYEFNWDGSDANGTAVSSGTYMYRLTAGNDVATAKMTLVR
jgi:hypothetical protein